MVETIPPVEVSLKAAVRGQHLGEDEVVAGQPVLARQPADPAAERQAGDAGGRHDAAGRGEAMALGRGVEGAPSRPRGRFGNPLPGIDANEVHRRQIEHDAVAGAVSRSTVAAAADGERKALGAGKVDPGDDVGAIEALDDRQRAAVDHAVPDPTQPVVAGIRRQHHPPLQPGGEGPDRTAFQNIHAERPDAGIAHRLIRKARRSSLKLWELAQPCCCPILTNYLDVWNT